MKEFLSSISYPALRENGEILVSPTLTLEPITLEHAKQMWPKVKENLEFFAKFLPWARNTNKELFSQYIEKCEANYRNGSERVYAIRANVDKFKNAIVGCISLQLKFAPGVKVGNAELGYYLFEEATGRNFIHESAQALCAITYTHDNVQRFAIYIDKENTSSRNVAVKLNAKFEGELRNYFGRTYCLYSYVLPDDFIQQNQLINDRLSEGNSGLTIEPFALEGGEFEELAQASRQATDNLNQAQAKQSAERILAQQTKETSNYTAPEPPPADDLEDLETTAQDLFPENK
ncbi:hypothetical protein CJP74_03775 [Psittacicella melopsittaci]|uniref:N-acetyltransferase domain-containing protein n=1 Tax=Psittacicella melopsittaci TaxID=2028576 RepID=A0A3A1Y9C0_9GAMM|nr:GNAT family N-acetyltransferase [Psittacicella melopsittaci]RIY32734.1 hypothetical protein CJP74_03775 [Psittacicella melopsittaci]